MNYRYRCSCGNVFDNAETSAVCPKCQKENSTDGCGIVQLYRLGNYVGCAVKMGLFVDEQPYGAIANKGNIKLVIPYGEHQLEATLRRTKTLKKPVVNLTPEQPEAYYKIAMDIFGTEIALKEAEKDSMPDK
ncbi:MAG: hypothetical protein IKP92_08275 [Lachnospiraceae bacterium]|nr:hypothetical protein [Lachnospiraceae bacterium]